MNISAARPDQASAIAALIMEAMNYDCCRFFAGPDHTLDDFYHLMTSLVETENSQYSYLNTLVAETPDGDVAGISVSYDGSRLHTLRRAFVAGARKAFGRDFSHIDDETQAGELYLDSLAVAAPFRGHGLATRLLRATAEKARRLHLPCVGLLVDTGNPLAERLYRRVGFRYLGDSQWGGHAMRHLVLPVPGDG